MGEYPAPAPTHDCPCRHRGLVALLTKFHWQNNGTGLQSQIGLDDNVTGPGGLSDDDTAENDRGANHLPRAEGFLQPQPGGDEGKDDFTCCHNSRGSG